MGLFSLVCVSGAFQLDHGSELHQIMARKHKKSLQSQRKTTFGLPSNCIIYKKSRAIQVRMAMQHPHTFKLESYSCGVWASKIYKNDTT
jgi:hypothetical protein